MKNHSNRASKLFLLLSLPLILPRQVYAYIDPGSGSYLIQIIIASLVGILISFKSIWVKIKSIIFKSSKKVNEKDN